MTGPYVTRIIDHIVEQRLRTVSVIGLAKNTGKTVTLNALAEQAYRSGIKTALVSFGRDGEQVDAITRLDKPRIRIFPGTLFVTAERFLNPAVVDIAGDEGTGIPTVFGEARIYTAGPAGGSAELIGINRVSSLHATLNTLKRRADLILIDGALDRRSSANPLLSDGCVLATGAVLGRDKAEVVRATGVALERLRAPGVTDPILREAALEIYHGHDHGVVLSDGRTVRMQDGAEAVTYSASNDSTAGVILHGAITDRLVERLPDRRDRQGLTLVVRDATRIFLGAGHTKSVAARNIRVCVLDPLRVIALTVNPTRPHMPAMDSRQIVDDLRAKYPDVLCFDVLRQG